MVFTEKYSRWLGRFATSGLIVLAAIGLWLGQASRDRAYAVSAGPAQATVTYTLTDPGQSDVLDQPAWADAAHTQTGSTATVGPLPPKPLVGWSAGSGADLIDPSGFSYDQGYRARAWGPLRTARAIAILVPGVGHSPAEFDSQVTSQAGAVPMTLPERAQALLEAAADPDLAVVAWLGYHPPSGVTQALVAPDQTEIRTGAANLVALESFLYSVNPRAEVSWICHSYGSLICASALHASSQSPSLDAGPSAIALLGSPGVQANDVQGLPTSAQVWAGQGPEDFIHFVPLLNLVGGGFGPDPAAPSFGARPIPCEPGAGHSDYFQADTIQLQTLASIVSGATHD